MLRLLDPRVVAGFDEPADLEPSVGSSGRRDFRRLISLLEQPLVAAGVGPEKRPVYHLVIAAKKDRATRLCVTQTTDQTVRGSNPFGRAPKPQVSGLLLPRASAA